MASYRSNLIEYDEEWSEARGDELDADAEGDDELVRGDSEEEVPHVGGLQAKNEGGDSVNISNQLQHVYNFFCVYKKVLKFCIIPNQHSAAQCCLKTLKYIPCPSQCHWNEFFSTC